ncbi:MAG: hypothetical protein BWY99_01675 [Synergistetes bacterium ADurb.BinA166]|nr:MAG: hypothetical protein BWY99_01675 [Synergistetes bacterium ADurb.BinA166]
MMTWRGEDVDKIVEGIIHSFPGGKPALAKVMSESVRQKLYECPRCGQMMTLVDGLYRSHSYDECVIHTVMEM